jgi:uncharacterized protein YidB (DUF937 family)
MAKGLPSMTALLALLAVAGYQHRDKIGDMLRKGAAKDPQLGDAGLGGLSSFLGEIGALFTGHNAGNTLSEGVGSLVERLRSAGHADAADSWISTRDNHPLPADHLESALGEDTLAELTQKTGLTRSEVLDRLSRVIPDAVNGFTPDGRLPTPVEAQGHL